MKAKTTKKNPKPTKKLSTKHIREQIKELKKVNAALTALGVTDSTATTDYDKLFKWVAESDVCQKLIKKLGGPADLVTIIKSLEKDWHRLVEDAIEATRQLAGVYEDAAGKRTASQLERRMHVLAGQMEMFT